MIHIRRIRIPKDDTHQMEPDPEDDTHQADPDAATLEWLLL